MSDGSIFDLSQYGDRSPRDRDPGTLKPGGSGRLLERDGIHGIQRGYLFDLIGPIRDLLESTTETPNRDSLTAMIGAVIGVHSQYSGLGDVEIGRAPQWLEAIEAADPDIARHTRALQLHDTPGSHVEIVTGDGDIGEYYAGLKQRLQADAARYDATPGPGVFADDATADLKAVRNIFDAADDDARVLDAYDATGDETRYEPTLEERVNDLEARVQRLLRNAYGPNLDGMPF